MRRLLAELATLEAEEAAEEAFLRVERRERWKALQATWRRPRRLWTKCGARCRDGHACQASPVRGRGTEMLNRNGRCRMHGGLSTGPRTPEGKARVAAAARRMMLERWKAKKASPAVELPL